MILSAILVTLDFTITLKCLEVLRCPTVVMEQVMAHSLSIDKSMRSSYKVWNQNLIFWQHQMDPTHSNSSWLLSYLGKIWRWTVFHHQDLFEDERWSNDGVITKIHEGGTVYEGVTWYCIHVRVRLEKSLEKVKKGWKNIPKKFTILYLVLGHYPCKDCAHHKSHLFSHKSPASQSITSQLCMIAFFNQKNRILEESQAILWEAWNHMCTKYLATNYSLRFWLYLTTGTSFPLKTHSRHSLYTCVPLEMASPIFSLQIDFAVANLWVVSVNPQS